MYFFCLQWSELFLRWTGDCVIQPNAAQEITSYERPRGMLRFSTVPIRPSCHAEGKSSLISA